MSDPTDGINIIRSAYQDVVERWLRDAVSWREKFPPTPEQKAARLERQHAENERRINLMRDHMNLPGTTSICQCGHDGYSTHGYLLHVYEVIAEDACDCD